LGGPIFGTTRAVDSLLAETGGALKPVRLPWIVTEMQGKKNEAAKQSASLAAATPNAVPPSLVPAKPEAPRDTKPAVGESQASAKATNVAAALTGAPVKKFAAVRSAKAAKSTSAPKGAKKKGGQNGPFTGKGAYGDPLAM